MRPLPILLAACLLLPLIAAVASGLLLRESTLAQARAEAEDMALLLREHALRVLEAQEQVIARIDARTRGLSWDTIETSADIHGLLQTMRDQSPHVDGIWLVDPQGRTVNSADFFPMPHSTVTEREYFQVLRDRDETHLGEMIVGRLKGNLNFNLSRRRSPTAGQPPGTFDGLILVTSSLEYFEAFWGGIHAMAPHVVGLVRADGKLLARYPGMDRPPPRIPEASPLYRLMGERRSGTYEFVSAADGVERIYGFAKLGDYPAFLVFGIDRLGALKPWRDQMGWILLAALLGSAALTGMTVLAMANARRERKATARWRRAADALRAEVDRRTEAERDLVATERHVAELERMQAEIDAARARAEAADRDKTRFLAAASHDLRQPLQAMRSLSHLLVERLPEGPERELAAKLQVAVRANAGLVNALLDISKLDAGLTEPRPTRFPAQELLDEMAVEFGPVAAEKGLRLRVMPCAGWLETDRDLLGAIVRNLVSNAIRHTGSGGVAVGCRPAGDRLRIEVWDTGPGIPAAQREEIFKEFHQLQNPERDRAKGLGIGLATVDRLTKLLGLPLTLRSEPGRGSVFAITVPRARRAEAAPQRAATVTAEPRGRHVLVLEDDALQLAATEMMLGDWGCRVTAVSTVEAALEAARADPPDLLLTDFRLRGDRDGIAMVTALRQASGRDMPALLVTGELLLRDGLPPDTTVLAKPFHPEQLRAAIGAALTGGTDLRAA